MASNSGQELQINIQGGKKDSLKWQLKTGEIREISPGESGNDHFYFVLREGNNPNREDTPVLTSKDTIHRVVGLTDDPTHIISYPKWRASGNPERIRRKTGEGLHHVGFPDGTERRLRHNPRNFRWSETYGTFLPLTDFTQQKVEILDPRETLKRRLYETIPQLRGIRMLLQGMEKADSRLTAGRFGLDASLLVETDTPNSDIDLIFYGPPDLALAAYHAYFDNVQKQNYITTPVTNAEKFISRRRAYSPFATDNEIIEAENRKMSAFVTVDGSPIKFSILPINPTARTDFKLQPTGMYAAVSGSVNAERVFYEPDYVVIGDSKVIWGPGNIQIAGIYSGLPSKTGFLLKKGDRLVSTGEIMSMTDKDGKNERFVLAQFPWTEMGFGGKKLTTYPVVDREPTWREIGDYFLNNTFGKPAPDIDHIGT